MYFINPSGITVEVTDPKMIKELLKNPRFKVASQDDEKEYQADKIEDKEFSVYLKTSDDFPDGYGQSQKMLFRALLNEGVTTKRKYCGQKIGLLYSYPYGIESLDTQIKIIYTMFESTFIPSDWKRYLGMADLVLVPSKFCQEAFARRGIETKVLPLGYNDKVFTYKEKEEKEVFTFLHYDAFNTRKGWELVFKAFNEEFKDEPVKLILKTIKTSLPFPILKSQYPKVEVIKKELPQEELVDLLHNSDCFVFPSRGEGFGLTPLEALATGTPTIIPNASGMSEYFNPEYFQEVKVAGMIPAIYHNFSPDDVGEMIDCDLEDLKRQMRYVYEHRTEAYEKAAKGAKWVKEAYPISKTGKELATILKEYEQKTVKQRVTADVNFVSLFWASNGMGRVGEEVLLALDRMGIKVKAIPDYIEREDLQERTLELIDLSKEYYDSNTTLFYAVPQVIPKHLTEKNYLHIDWDTTKAPKVWVDNINEHIKKVYPSSEFVEGVFKDSGVKPPMTVIRHGVRSDRFPAFERDTKGDFTFLTCGDISLRKGTDVLIKAFEEAFPDEQDVKLVIKSNKSVNEGKIKVPDDPRIEVIEERYKHEDYLKLYEKADCYVAPSRDEGFCLPVLEAMSTALPVIVHNWSGMTSLANEEYNYPIGSGSPMKADMTFYPDEYKEDGIGDWKSPSKKELIEKMRFVYEHREEAVAKGKKASEWARSEWDWDKQVSKMWLDMAEQEIPELVVPKPPVKEWGEFYEDANITPEFVTLSSNAHKELFYLLKGFYPNKIIEAGCGPATMSAFLSMPKHEVNGVEINNHKFKEIVAMDNDKGVLEIAEKNLKQFGDVKLLNDDAFTCTETADLVFAQGVLEHLSNEQMRSLIENQLKQAPVVIHSVPNRDYAKIDFGNERLLSDNEFYRIFEGFDVTVYRYWNEKGVKKMSLLVFKRTETARPKVSITMPLMNSKEMSIKAIEAVRANTKDYELIVIDNASTDGIGEWLDQQKDLRVIHACQNLGVPAAKNLGIALAKGEYICFLDNDTEAGEGWLDDLLAVFNDKTVGFTGTDGYLIDKEKKWFQGTQFTEQSIAGQEIEWAGHSIFMFPRRLIKETGLLIDWDLWCIEDVDQCCKIRSLGYKGLMPSKPVNIKHLGGVTARPMIEICAKFPKATAKIWEIWGDFINNRDLGAKIDIGSGDNPKLGYIHVDIQPIEHVDIVAAADDLGLQTSSVAEIYSSHLAEHFTNEEFDKVLKEWRRVLKNGGILTIKCPDILTVCDKLLNKNVEYHLGVSWIYGGHRTKWDYHYWGYTFDTLKKKLEKIGFTNVEKLDDPDDWLKVKAICEKKENKLKQPKEPLKVLFEGNHHHIFGGGENMTFGVIKMLNDMYDGLEVDIDTTKIDIKKGFDIDLGTLEPKSGRENDLYVCISHFSLPNPEGKKSIAVVFYPQYDWTEDIKKYDKVVAISKYSADAIKQKWGVDAVIIPPSLDTHKFGTSKKKNQIISVGRFFWQPAGNNKNQHILIKAFSQMPRDWKLILVGSVQNDKYFNTLKKMAKGLNVEFIHEIPFDGLVDLYAESKLFWSATGYGSDIPSSQEHFGMVAVEALASGCRTLVYNGGGMKEINGVETWDTIDDLVKLSLDDKPYDIKALIDGTKRYSTEEVSKQWKALISDLTNG